MSIPYEILLIIIPVLIRSNVLKPSKEMIEERRIAISED